MVRLFARLYDYSTGLSMLIPQAYDASWTGLREGEIFNAYPPSNVPQLDGVLSDNTYGQVVPIPFSTSQAFLQNALLPASSRRGYLLIQNNSVIGGASDVLPNLYIAYDGPVSTTLPLGLNKVIAPGTGLVLDRRVPGNAIYAKWGTFTNTSGTAFAGGVIEQGLIPLAQTGPQSGYASGG